jgi:RecQ-mediated genome instability protein 1
LQLYKLTCLSRGIWNIATFATRLPLDRFSAWGSFQHNIPIMAQPAIKTFLDSKGLSATQAWIESFVTSTRQGTPIPALQKTALFRILASDLTSSIKPTPTNTLPPNALNPTVKELRVPDTIPVQILDIEDIGRSAWSQVEAIEAQERGETTKGREVIRVVPGEEADPTRDGTAPIIKSNGPHKLLLQDAKGTKIYGFEITDVDGVDLNLGIGAKLILKNVTIARGVILLDPNSTQLLGGKVDVWDKAWRAARKETLKAKVGPREEDEL